MGTAVLLFMNTRAWEINCNESYRGGLPWGECAGGQERQLCCRWSTNWKGEAAASRRGSGAAAVGGERPQEHMSSRRPQRRCRRVAVGEQVGLGCCTVVAYGEFWMRREENEWGKWAAAIDKARRARTRVGAGVDFGARRRRERSAEKNLSAPCRMRIISDFTSGSH